jgi:hypothetical protein
MNAQPRLIETRIRAGHWEGVLQGAPVRPQLRVVHLERDVQGIALEPVPERAGDWAVRVPIPVETLSDGVQTYLIQDSTTGERLGHFTIAAGALLDDDIRAEVDLLRAELDLLKRAFRRHCVETGV